MEILSDPTPDMLAMPRFDDGAIDMQELLRRLAEQVVNAVMDAEADQLCGGGGNSRNGYRERSLATCVGTLTLRIPKPHSSPPSKTSEFAIEGDLPRLLTIGLHEAPRSNILWTVSLSYLVSEPAVGPRMKLPIETGRMMGGRWNRAPRHLPSRAIILRRSHRQQREFVMKVLLVNGSPKANGNTARALAEVAEQLNAEGIDTEVFQLGTKPIRDCIGCGQCGKLDCRCTFDDDVVNELIAAAEQADGFVFGSPVYYAHPSGRILSALDRAFYAGSKAFAHKPGAAVAVARRGGTSTTFDVLNKYFTIKQMPVVASTYWNNVFGRVPGDADGDAEGLATMRNIGKNMAWLLRCIEAGQAAGINAPEADRATTNFIR